MLRLSLLFFALSMLLINFASNLSDTSETVDVFGHLGGALSGFLIGLAVYPRPVSRYSSSLKVAGHLLLALYFVGATCYLFCIRADAQDPYYGIDVSKYDDGVEIGGDGN